MADLKGTSGDDIIDGTVDADQISGGTGNDTITGGDSADTIYGGTAIPENDLDYTYSYDTVVYSGANSSWTTIQFDSWGKNYVISTKASNSGVLEVNLLNDDGSLERVAWLTATGTIVNINNGDGPTNITQQVVDSGIDADDLNKAMTQPSYFINSDGFATIILTGQNGLAIAAIDLTPNGELVYRDGYEFDGDGHAGVRGGAIYEAPDGSVYYYAARLDGGVSSIEYDDTNNVFLDSTVDYTTHSSLGTSVSSTEIASVDGVDYLLVSDVNGITVFEINQSTGDLVYSSDVVSSTTDGSANSVEVYYKPDGTA